MNDWEKKPTIYPRPSDELRKLITEHPDLPLLVMAGDNANDGDHSYTVCSYIRAELGEVLDCEQGVDDTMIFTDRDEFEEKLGDNFYDPELHEGLTDEEQTLHQKPKPLPYCRNR